MLDSFFFCFFSLFPWRRWGSIAGPILSDGPALYNVLAHVEGGGAHVFCLWTSRACPTTVRPLPVVSPDAHTNNCGRNGPTAVALAPRRYCFDAQTHLTFLLLLARPLAQTIAGRNDIWKKQKKEKKKEK